MDGGINYKGLSSEEVTKARTQYGANIITKSKRNGLFRSFIGNFGDPMIKILLVALGIQVVFLFGNAHLIETLGIVAAILVAVVVSTLSEYGSENAFRKLSQIASATDVRVRRNGAVMLVPIADIVVGDIVLIGMGDKIPADGRILSGSVEVDQSLLNGESKEAKKLVTEYKGKEDFLNPLLVFCGTVVTHGEAVMRVEAVGDKTVYGKIAAELQEVTPISPLKLKLQKLASTISLIGYIGAGMVAVSYMFSVFVLQGSQVTFNSLIDMATLVVAVIVMAVPEGLPMMITVVLSANMKSMLKDNVLIRKLGGIETAGSMNILFTDKTGTLTHGKLEVIGIVDPNGIFHADLKHTKQERLAKQISLNLRHNTSAEISANGRAVGGNSTDRILLEYAQSLPQTEAVKISQIPFDSARKFMSTTLSDGKVLLKGAPDIVFAKCRVEPAVYKTVSELSEKSVRLVAVAIDNNLVGLVAIRDRVRKEAVQSIKRLESAGIQTIMITGDSVATAKAVAYEVGILTSPESRDKNNTKEIVLTSDEMAALTDKQLAEMLPRIRVVARALPSDKSRLVRIAQSLNLVTGMTGDGVNDAPALKKADIGFAMGSGTEVAKEAGDIVIIDDNINSISRAVLYGRTIFKSIRKFLIFKLTINFCAMAICVVAPLVKIDTPITVIQMLWINLVMDTLAGLAFGGEKPRIKYMTESPKRRDEPIINRYMWQQILLGSIFTFAISLWFLINPSIQDHFNAKGAAYAMTGFFMFFMFINIFNSFNARTHELNPLSYLSLNKVFVVIMGFVSIASAGMIFFGGAIFRTVPLSFIDFIIVIMLALLIFPADMLRKIIINRRGEVAGT